MKKQVVVWTQAYNEETRLRRAMDSVLAQTYPHLCYYVLDNGSEDATWEIICEYAARDPRVVPLRNEENFVMAGIDYLPKILKAHGKDYFCWLDADDALSKDFLEKMVRFITEKKLDIAACGTRFADEKLQETLRVKRLEQDLIVEGQGFADEFIQYRTYTNEMWGKLYRCDMFSRGSLNSLSYWHGDSSLVINLLNKCRRFGIMAEPLYHCGVRAQSDSRDMQYKCASRTKSNVRGELGTVAGMPSAITGMRESYRIFLEEYGDLSPENLEYLDAIYLGHIWDLIPQIGRLEAGEADKLRIIKRLLYQQETQDMLRAEYTSRFQNLNRRDAFREEVRSLVETLGRNPRYQRQRDEIFELLSAR